MQSMAIAHVRTVNDAESGSTNECPCQHQTLYSLINWLFFYRNTFPRPIYLQTESNLLHKSYWLIQNWSSVIVSSPIR